MPYLFTILIVTLLFYVPEKAGSILFERDLVLYSLPLKKGFLEELFAGNIPLWNPYIYCGYPFLGDAVVGHLYPGNIVYLFMPFHIGFLVFCGLHSFLGAAFMYYFLLRRGCSRTSALIGGLTYSFSGYLISVVHTQTFLVTSTFIPLYLLLLDKLEKGNFFKITLLCMIPFFAQLIYGDLLTLVVTVVIGVSYALVVLKKDRFLLAKHLGISIVTSGLLAMVILIPFVELTLLSDRFIRGVRLEEAVEFSLNPLRLLGLLIPYFEYYDFYPLYMLMWSKYFTVAGRQAPWAESLYLGIIPVVIVLSCFFFIWKEKIELKYWFFIGIIGLLISFGNYLKLYNVLYYVFPGMNLFRYPEKIFLVFTLAVAVITGLSFEKIVFSHHKRLFMISLPIFILFLLTFVFKTPLVELISLIQESYVKPAHAFYLIQSKFQLTVIFLSVFLFVILLYHSKKLTEKSLSLILILIVCCDLIATNRAVLFFGPASIIDDRPVIEKYLYRHSEDSYFRIRSFRPGEATSTFTPEFYRFKIKHLNKELLFHNSVVPYKIPSMQGFVALELNNYVNLESYVDTFEGYVNSFSIFSVNYVLYNEEKQNLEHLGLKRLYSVNHYGNNFILFKNINALPHSYIVYNSIYEKEAPKAAKIVHTPDFNYKRTVVTGKNVEFINSNKVLERAYIEKYENERVEITAKSDAPGVLVLTDTFYPGWNAYINGKKTDCFLVNGYFRGVLIPKGESQVIFKYEPLSVYIGALVSLLTLVGLIRVGVWRVLKRKRGST